MYGWHKQDLLKLDVVVGRSRRQTNPNPAEIVILLLSLNYYAPVHLIKEKIFWWHFDPFNRRVSVQFKVHYGAGQLWWEHCVQATGLCDNDCTCANWNLRD